MYESNEDDMKRKALEEALKGLVAKMSEVDMQRMKDELSNSADEDSEQPIDPKNLDPSHTEAEEEGGHPGEVPASAVDAAEKDAPETEEDKKNKRKFSFRG